MKALERLVGPPLAAPETPAIRRLRLSVVALAFMLGVGILLVGFIRQALGPVLTGGIFAVLGLATAVLAAIYFIGKTRRDDAWLDSLIADRGDA